MKKLVISRPDGGVSIVHPAPNAIEELGLKTEQELEDYLVARYTAEGHSVVSKIDDVDLPDDSAELIWDEVDGIPTQRMSGNAREFRDDWTWSGSGVVTDPTKKVERKKSKAREVRNKLLEQSDTEAMVATERGDARLPQLKTYRQELRDLGTQIDADPDNITWPVKP